MIHKLRIGIRAKTSKREATVTELFVSVKGLIKNKKEFLYDIQFEDYNDLKKEFDEKDIDSFEIKDNQKSVCDFEKKIILFNNSFFGCSAINQQSVFIHEIGHIINQPQKEAINNFQNFLVKRLYMEYLADSYLLDIDKNIFLNGRIIPDLSIISADKIKDSIDTSEQKEHAAKYKFVVLGRLYYYYSLYEYQPILPKVNELIALLKKYFSNIDSVLGNFKSLCNQLKSKQYHELEDLFDKVESDICGLKVG